MSVHVLALSASHDFSKIPVHEVTLLTGLGVKGDCHLGVTVQHRSRLHITPSPPNLRQVHLISKEALDQRGLVAGDIRENVTTAGIDLLALGRGTQLHFLPPPTPASTPSPPLKTSEHGSENGNDKDETEEGENHAVVVVQGLRNPCPQIDRFRAGLKDSFLVRDGVVRVGIRIVVEEPEGGFEELGCV
ncbi:pyruvate kinase-like protein [Corynascus novoguineensis]|uniref:Pyruvate kinase-like protein n=1 Tax=Corynascus novoguineensis TaxID=1126955 RepID=A0AAN7HAX9_9PEZI|nr:pyruvate kinase-like protein [Corynascus novoguineensis]